MRSITRFVVVGLLATVVLLAQNPYGRITGRVTDESGAFVPGVAVHATNIETGVRTNGRSNQDGNFEITSLIPGRYRVEAESSGFKRYERPEVEVRVGDVLNLQIKLEVGQVSESVTVKDEAPLLESATSSLGQVVDNRRIQDLPVPGASLLYLTTLMPSVMSMQAPTYPYTPNTLGGSSDIAAAGAKSRSGEFTVDGIPTMARGGQISFAPPPEMVQEFRVQTAPFDASLGRFTGAHVNIVMKSGTNTLHGGYTMSHMNRSMMSLDYFTRRFLYDTSSGPVTSEKFESAWPEQHTTRHRLTVNGPVYLPNLYNGRNPLPSKIGVSPKIRR